MTWPPAADVKRGEPPTLLATLSAERLRVSAPAVTVVIPVFNNWFVTSRCLESLLQCDVDVALQVVVVDDGSTDETASRLAELPGIDVVRNGWNLGFVHSCNRGAGLARAPYVLFLNNDTELTRDALSALVRRITSDDGIGIVGSKLVYPDGRLQEAGGIIWSDAGGWNYGRFDVAQKAQYNYAREVDYVSGASLLVRADLFRKLGGFDERFAPGYYEDADLCFAARACEKRVMYEPASVVVHYEGVTSGTDTSAGMKRYQTVNRRKFGLKWGDTLARDHEESDPSNVQRAARRNVRAKTSILVVDSYVPLYDQDAGSSRIKQLIDGFRANGLHVVFFPDNLIATAPYTRELQNSGIEVMYWVPNDARSWRQFFIESLEIVDVAWISRPDLCRKYLPIVRRESKLPVLYDTIDLHHLRLRRQSMHDNSVDTATWQRVERLELSCAMAADTTIVVSDYEAAILREAGIDRVAIVPTIHDIEPPRQRSFNATSGILFIGGYGHVPNVDAVAWLIDEIMPLVWQELPAVTVTLLGAHPPQSVRDRAGPQVLVPGFIHDVSSYFESARVFVAPMRFGAGLKGKVGQALGYGLPLVTTSVGAEGFNLRPGVDALVADETATFARAILDAYQDAARWDGLATAAAAALEPFSSKRVVDDAIKIIEGVISTAGEHE